MTLARSDLLGSALCLRGTNDIYTVRLYDYMTEKHWVNAQVVSWGFEAFFAFTDIEGESHS